MSGFQRNLPDLEHRQSVLRPSNSVSFKYLRLFAYTDKFNSELSSWDVRSVTNMSHMFHYAHAFDQPLNLWNTASVTTLASTF